MSTNGKATGKIAAAQGSAVNSEYDTDALPEICEALEVQMSRGSLVLEGQMHLGGNVVRAVAQDNTNGLRRGQVRLTVARRYNPRAVQE
jgi:F-type H+/Na+-transporting ATPase subunit beta